MTDDFAFNGPEQIEQLRKATTAAWEAVKGQVSGMAIVVVLPGGCVSAGIVAGNADALSALIKFGPTCLVTSVARMMVGLGITIVETTED